QGQIGLQAGFDVRAKTLALPVHVGHGAPFQAVVVQAGFADADHAGQAAALKQVIQGGLLHAFVVWVHAHRGPEVVEALRQGMHLRKFFKRGADAQCAIHARISHVLADLIELVSVVGEIEMAVGVDEHGGKREEIGGFSEPAILPQSVWVGLLEDKEVPSVCSILMRNWRVLSSAGKRTPTPWVRPPEALAGVTQAILPATGWRWVSSGRDSSR